MAQCEIRIYGVSEKMRDDLKSIAKDKYGMTLNEFLKGKFPLIIDGYYEKDKKEKPGK